MRWLTLYLLMSLSFQFTSPAFLSTYHISYSRKCSKLYCRNQLPDRLERTSLKSLQQTTCVLSGESTQRVKYPPIPLITTFEKSILLPGESIDVDNPSPGTLTAISVAKAFVSQNQFAMGF